MPLEGKRVSNRGFKYQSRVNFRISRVYKFSTLMQGLSLHKTWLSFRLLNPQKSPGWSPTYCEEFSKLLLFSNYIFKFNTIPGFDFPRGPGSYAPTGLDGPQKDQVGWWGYLNPKSGSPASILGSPAIYSKKEKWFFFPLFMLVMVLMPFSSIL